MEKKRLELINPKFKNEHVCPACQGYFLDENKDVVLCKTCIKNGRVNPLGDIPEKDVIHRDVNVTELSKKVIALEALVKSLTKDKTPEITLAKKEYKPKNCAQCEKEFTPLASAQKICQDCRTKLIS